MAKKITKPKMTEAEAKAAQQAIFKAARERAAAAPKLDKEYDVKAVDGPFPNGSPCVAVLTVFDLKTRKEQTVGLHLNLEMAKKLATIGKWFKESFADNEEDEEDQDDDE